MNESRTEEGSASSFPAAEPDARPVILPEPRTEPSPQSDPVATRRSQEQFAEEPVTGPSTLAVAATMTTATVGGGVVAAVEAYGPTAVIVGTVVTGLTAGGAVVISKARRKRAAGRSTTGTRRVAGTGSGRASRAGVSSSSRRNGQRAAGTHKGTLRGRRGTPSLSATPKKGAGGTAGVRGSRKARSLGTLLGRHGTGTRPARRNGRSTPSNRSGNRRSTASSGPGRGRSAGKGWLNTDKGGKATKPISPTKAARAARRALKRATRQQGKNDRGARGKASWRQRAWWLIAGFARLLGHGGKRAVGRLWRLLRRSHQADFHPPIPDVEPEQTAEPERAEEPTSPETSPPNRRRPVNPDGNRRRRPVDPRTGAPKMTYFQNLREAIEQDFSVLQARLTDPEGGHWTEVRDALEELALVYQELGSAGCGLGNNIIDKGGYTGAFGELMTALGMHTSTDGERCHEALNVVRTSQGELVDYAEGNGPGVFDQRANDS